MAATLVDALTKGRPAQWRIPQARDGACQLDAIAVQAKLIEGSEMEARLAELERQAGAVDFRPRGA